MPKSRLDKLRRHKKIRLVSVVIRGLPVKDLFSAGSACSPWGYMHGISVVVSQNVDLSVMQFACGVPGTRRLAALPTWASTFQQGCLLHGLVVF